MIDVETGATHEIVIKEAIIEPLAKSSNMVGKEKLNGESRTMLVNIVNLSQKTRTKFDSKYEMVVFENEHMIEDEN